MTFKEFAEEQIRWRSRRQISRYFIQDLLDHAAFPSSRILYHTDCVTKNLRNELMLEELQVIAKGWCRQKPFQKFCGMNGDKNDEHS